jgi:hypothetical protein
MGKLVLTKTNSANLQYDLARTGTLGAANGFNENAALQDDQQ